MRAPLVGAEEVQQHEVAVPNAPGFGKLSGDSCVRRGVDLHAKHLLRRLPPQRRNSRAGGAKEDTAAETWVEHRVVR